MESQNSFKALTFESNFTHDGEKYLLFQLNVLLFYHLMNKIKSRLHLWYRKFAYAAFMVLVLL